MFRNIGVYSEKNHNFFLFHKMYLARGGIKIKGAFRISQQDN